MNLDQDFDEKLEFILRYALSIKYILHFENLIGKGGYFLKWFPIDHILKWKYFGYNGLNEMYFTGFFWLLKNVATVQFKGTKVSCFYYYWAVLGSSVSHVSTTPVSACVISISWKETDWEGLSTWHKPMQPQMCSWDLNLWPESLCFLLTSDWGREFTAGHCSGRRLCRKNSGLRTSRSEYQAAVPPNLWKTCLGTEPASSWDSVFSLCH